MPDLYPAEIPELCKLHGHLFEQKVVESIDYDNVLEHAFECSRCGGRFTVQTFRQGDEAGRFVPPSYWASTEQDDG